LYHPRLSPEQQGTTTIGAAGAMQLVVSPSERATQVLLELGYASIRLYPFPEQLERGQIIGPTGGSITTADGIELLIPEGGLPERTVVSATLLSDNELQSLGLAIQGFDLIAAIRTDLGGHTLARAATMTLTLEIDGTAQLLIGELVEHPTDGRESLVQLVARSTQIAGSNGLPDRLIAKPEPAGSDLPLVGMRNEALYLVLRAQQPIAYATGFVRAANTSGLANARVTATNLGTADLSRDGGRYTAVVTTATPTLVAWHPTLQEQGTATIPSLVPDQVSPIDLTVQPIPPAITNHQPTGTDIPFANLQLLLSFSEPIDATSVTSSTLRLELLDLANQSTGAFAPGTVALSGPTTISFKPTYRLQPHRSYRAIFTGGIRDLSGITYQGPTPFTWTFTTAALTASDQVNPDRIMLSIPVDGISQITGLGPDPDHNLPAAIPGGTDYLVSAYVDNGLADPLRTTITVNPNGSFSLTVGSTDNPVTLTSKIWLQVFFDDG
ncbi:MAG: Ig-like domain-containing protein, partial [bacterium]|nr:Ig-like domain-containing protein [bacterium]